ncbi:hypothetical protein ACJMK2_034782 [Sinanodonta woodiana]|uniref:Uncharacterized protein n=1 Tax=Sinanodonta woodiana TaxID=1069815 RepID=A0ABD3WSR0_SINWO
MIFVYGCALVTVLALVARSVTLAKTASFELEKIVLGKRWDSERFIFRSRASSHMIIHLFKGDILKLDMCTGKATNVSIHDIVYSNDGNSDLVNITTDRKEFVSFYSVQGSDWGHLWNEFHHVNASGSNTTMSAGSQSMYIYIQEADCYGIELDKIEVELDEHADSASFWCGYELRESHLKSDCMRIVNVKDDSHTTTTTKTSTSEAEEHISLYSKETVQTSTTKTVYLDVKKETLKQPTVKQKSYTSDCGDTTNVNLEFSFLEIKNTTLTVQTTKLAKPFTTDSGTDSTVKDSCKSIIWRLGIADKSNAEFSQITPKSNVNFFVHNDKVDTSQFPGQIDTSKTSWILLTFSLLRENVLDAASNAFLTVGLSDLTTNITIDVRYYDWSKENLSAPYSNLFFPGRKIMGWSIPATSISPLHYNHFYMFFPNAENIQVKFDFLRLDYLEILPKTTRKILYEMHRYKVEATQYVGNNKVDISNIGMLVNLTDASPQNSKTVSMKSVKSIDVLLKGNVEEQFSTVLGVHANGVIYPHFRSKPPIADNYGTEQKDVSGFIFDNARSHLSDAEAINPISSVFIIITTMEIFIHDRQNHTFSFQLLPSDLSTTVLFRNATVPKNGRYTLTFFSSFVSERLSTVDTLHIDDRETIQIMSNFGTKSGSVFKVEHTSLTSDFPHSQITILKFPN